jgi:hypothetical protein
LTNQPQKSRRWWCCNPSCKGAWKITCSGFD